MNRFYMPTFSHLERASLCAPSTQLFKVRLPMKAAPMRGHALHRYAANALTYGVEAALHDCPTEFYAECEVMDVEELRAIVLEVFDGQLPRAIICEQKLSYDVATHAARDLGQGTDRNYGDLAETEVAGTVDLAAHVGSVGFVGDIKTGRRSVTRAKANKQVRAGALAFASLHKLDTMHVVIGYLRHDGSWYWDRATFDSFDLTMIAVELQELHKAEFAVYLAIQSGRLPDVAPSVEACRYCESVAMCPASTLPLARLVAPEGKDPLLMSPEELSALMSQPEAAAKAWRAFSEWKEKAEKVIENWETAFKITARRNPIPLGNGKELREEFTPYESIKPDVALVELMRKFGPDVAQKAVKLATSKTAIKEAITEHAKATGSKVAPLLRDALEAIENAKGIDREERSTGLREKSAATVKALKGAA